MILLYIDPGTGSLIITSLIALFVTLKNFFVDTYYRIISLFKKEEFKIKNDFSDQLVFFSEGKKYWSVFKPVIQNLVNKKVPFIFLSADSDDPGLKFTSNYISSHYIGKMNTAIIFLNKLKASMLVTTTPQLGILQWKRSKNVFHYCYINHSPVDIHSYKKFAFDYYDSILCTSTFQIESLKHLEIVRNSKRKILLETGCTYYDTKIKNSNENILKDHILIAPTWGDRSFFFKYGFQIIENILSKNFKIILRPHPQSWISDSKYLNNLILNFKNNKKFSIDKNTNSEDSILKSKILITDISSGMVHDIIFLKKIPVVAIDFSWDDGGYESSSLNSKSASNLIINDFGKVVKEDDLEFIGEIIEKLNPISINKKNIDKHIFNFQNSSKIASSQILNIYNNLTNATD